MTATCATATAADDAPSELRFAKIFTDHMILQQQKPIVVWGWASPGEDVAVTLTQDRAVGEAAMARVFELAAERNIRRPPAPEDDGSYAVTVQYVEKNAPKIRPQTVEAKADADGRWSVEFAPAAASFLPTWIVANCGEQIVGVQDVLIGELWVCAGQSNMGWGNFNRKDREAASADFPGLRYVVWDDSWYLPLDDLRRDVRWQVCTPEAAEQFSAVPYLYGMFLHRYLKVPVGIVNVARGGTLGQTWCMREQLESVDNEIIHTVLADYDAQTATWDDPQQVEQIMADWEKACDQARIDHEAKVAQAKADGKPKPRLRLPNKPGDPRSGWSPPAGLFNATIMPIRHLGIRGVLYYQGENNNFMRWTRYEYTFPRVPASFRQAFGDPELPFGCISQPGWGTFGLDPEVATIAEGYAIVRDIQRRALADDPNAGMIATYPTGNSYIHPGEKLPVAEYASLWALANVYDQPVVHRANDYREMKKRDNIIYLFFDSDPVVYERWKHIENNAYWQVLPCPREGNAEFQGFIIADGDRRWYPAKARHARLDGKPCIEVYSDLVDDPTAVRYGWANWPTGNLVGRNRLPMPTFRTDDWPIPRGVNFTKEAEQQCREVLNQLKAEGEKQALDRKIRQMQVDLPKLETELQLRKNESPKGLIQSKIARLEAILDEFQKDQWLSRRIAGEHVELGEELEAARKVVDALKSRAAAIEEER